METKFSKPRIQVPSTGRRSSSPSVSNIDSCIDESPHSPLRFLSPLPSDQGDPVDSPPYSSPISSPTSVSSDLHSLNSSIMGQVGEKKIHDSPALSPITSIVPHKATAPLPSADAGVVVMSKPEAMSSSFVKNSRPERPLETSLPSSWRRSRRVEMISMAEIGFRISKMAFSLISFSVMAADRTQGWAGDSFDRYKEYKFCLSVNVIAFVVSIFQAYDLGYYLSTGKRLLRHHLGRHFDFFVNQMLAYLLLSASSSAAARVDDWQSNWGKDKFTVMASASIALSFLSFIAFAGHSLLSGYNLFNYRTAGL